MLVAHHLTALLRAEEAAGRIRGEIVLVPAANPAGLSQTVLHGPVGRFDLADGRNFNRGFPWLAPATADAVAGRLGPEEAANRDAIRAALRRTLSARPGLRSTDHLKHTLLGLALDADIVLDMHCGSEAVQHLYTLTPLAEFFTPLAGLMGAQAVLLATESGDDPFDEACSRPWFHLRERFPDAPIPLACAAATLEFRGERDVGHALAEGDARSVLGFLILAGAVDGVAPVIPPAAAPTELAAAEPLTAPGSGILVFGAEPGAVLPAGAPVAEIVDPLTGVVSVVATERGGVLYTRTAARFVLAGARLGTVAAAGPPRRSGTLLSA